MRSWKRKKDTTISLPYYLNASLDIYFVSYSNRRDHNTEAQLAAWWHPCRWGRQRLQTGNSIAEADREIDQQRHHHSRYVTDRPGAANATVLNQVSNGLFHAMRHFCLRYSLRYSSLRRQFAYATVIEVIVLNVLFWFTSVTVLDSRATSNKVLLNGSLTLHIRRQLPIAGLCQRLTGTVIAKWAVHMMPLVQRAQGEPCCFYPL